MAPTNFARSLLATWLIGAAAMPLQAGAASAASPPPPGPSQSASSSVSKPAPVTFGVGPATNGKVDQRSGFILLESRGGGSTDQVALVNLTYKPLRLNLYAADVVNGSDGSLSVQPRTVAPTDAATWTTFKTAGGGSSVVVPARSTTIVPISVRVPLNAPVGDHLAAVVASTVTTATSPGVRSPDVSFEQRVAVRLAVRVAGVLKPGLAIEGLTASYAGSLVPGGKGAAVVSYTVRNIGNVRLGGRGAVSVGGPFGSHADATNVPDVPLLLPGGTATLTVEVPDILPLGPLTADVTVAALAPPTDADPAVAVATATTRLWAIPWTLLAALLLLGLLGGWWWRRRADTTPPTPGRRERRVASDDAHTGDLVSAGPVANSLETPA